MKGFALDLSLQVWVFGNRKWSILTFPGVKSYFYLFQLYFLPFLLSEKILIDCHQFTPPKPIAGFHCHAIQNTSR